MSIAALSATPYARARYGAQRACTYLRALTGWRRFTLTFAAGLLSALAFAPYGVFPLLLLGYALLVVLIDGAVHRPHAIRAAFGAGWAFGFGQFLAGLYWIVYPFLVDPLQHAWQIPFAVTILPAGLALFPAIAAAVSAALWRKGYVRILVFTACFAAAAYLRGHILTGFPWNLPAYGWGASLAVLQSASVLGAYGLSLLTILFGASLALIADDEPRAAAVPAILTATFLLIWGVGMARLAELPARDVPGVRLRLVQPDVPQDEKYVAQYRLRNWERLIRLSTAPGRERPTILVWPEAAPPFLLQRASFAYDDIARLTEGRTVLMTGAVRATLRAGADPRFYNSFFIFADDGAPIATYDKFHLVPFGEYLPLAPLLHAIGVDKLVDMPGSFSSGDGPHTFQIPGAPSVGPLICYEIIFPDAVIGRQRPGWLVNVTDDSWFGPPGSSGPDQHLLSAQVRAIEEGLAVARDTNTGISAIIDPEGRITTALGSGKMGVVDGALPQPLNPTIYARFGDSLFFLFLIVCAVIAYIGERPLSALGVRNRFPPRRNYG